MHIHFHTLERQRGARTPAAAPSSMRVANQPPPPPSQLPHSPHRSILSKKTKPKKKNTKYSRDECAYPVRAGVAGERLRRCRIYLHESETVRECLSVYMLCWCEPQVGPCLFFTVSYVYISSFSPSEDEVEGRRAGGKPTLMWRLKIYTARDFSFFFFI